MHAGTFVRLVTVIQYIGFLAYKVKEKPELLPYMARIGFFLFLFFVFFFLNLTQIIKSVLGLTA